MMKWWMVYSSLCLSFICAFFLSLLSGFFTMQYYLPDANVKDEDLGRWVGSHEGGWPVRWFNVEYYEFHNVNKFVAICAVGWRMYQRIWTYKFWQNVLFYFSLISAALYGPPLCHKLVKLIVKLLRREKARL